MMKPSDFHSHDAYFILATRDYLCAHMLMWGYRMFTQAKCIKNIKQYEELVVLLEDTNKNQSKPPENLVEKIGFFAFESLLDSIKISICFENYFKVILLTNGFIIHKLNAKNGDENIKLLKKNQKNKPLHINEVFSNDKVLQIKDVKYYLSENTLDFSTLLKPEYCKEYQNITPELIKFLVKTNDNRNQLHLYLSENFSVGRSIYNCLLGLNKIVLCDIAVRQNLLIDKYSQNKKGQKLPIKCE